MALWLQYVKAWVREETGQDLAEYALLIGLIALVVVAAVTTLGGGITATFNAIAAAVTDWGTP